MKYKVVSSPFTYKGFSFNTYAKEHNKPAYDGLLDRMIRVVYFGKSQFRQPAGFHIRFKAAESVGIAQIMDRVRKFYARATPTKRRKASSTFNPVYFLVREIDRTEDGEHFHLMLILDLKRAKVSSVYGIFDRLVRGGSVQHYDIAVSMTRKSRCIELSDEVDTREFIDWMGYLCKVYSKDIRAGVKSSYSTHLPAGFGIPEVGNGEGSLKAA